MSKNINKVLPVLFGFLVMGFCDVVGIATSYVGQDFNLSETVAGLIPSMVFLWFLILSVPSALLMDKIGRKRTVQLSNLITFVGMLLPFFDYSFAVCMAAFVMLGIGNTILQVSLNPLLTNVVDGKALTSSLTIGQVVKAVSSFLGPFIAAFAAGQLGNWKYLFPIYAAITLVSMLWLMSVRIGEEAPTESSVSLRETFGLLGDRKILLLFLGIFFIVGIDVGVNTVAPKLMMERVGWLVEKAGLASSVYFVCRTVGALVGSVALTKVNEAKYFKYNISAAVLSLVALMFVKGHVPVLIILGLLGFLCSSIFPIIYSAAMKSRPDKANVISGLMVTGVSGGAAIPPLMGVMADAIGNQTGSQIVILLCAVYLTACSFWLCRIDPDAK